MGHEYDKYQKEELNKLADESRVEWARQQAMLADLWFISGRAYRIGLLVLLFVSLVTSYSISESIAQGLAFFLPVVVIYSGIFYGRRAVHVKLRSPKSSSESTIADAAHALGYQYAESADVNTLSAEFVGDTQDGKPSVTHVLSGTFQGHKFRSFDYSFHGHNRRLLEVTTTNKFPDVVLFSRTDSWSQLNDLTHTSMRKRGYIELEGDFNDFFIVMAHEGMQHEVWEMLSPDVMEILIQEGRSFSYLFSGDRMYVGSYLSDEDEEEQGGAAYRLALQHNLEGITGKFLARSSRKQPAQPFD